MYVCMYVCMYVFMYVCMYVCMHAYIYACMYAINDNEKHGRLLKSCNDSTMMFLIQNVLLLILSCHPASYYF